MTSPPPTFLHRRALLVLALASAARAQYYDPYYDGNGSTPGRVIAGIVVAICIAILFLICFALMFRRRRRGLTVLPSYAGGSYFSSGTQTGAHSHRINQNQNQGPYAAYPMSNQQAWGGYQPPPGPPPPQDEQAPPPPYPGKPKPYDGEENSGYGYPHSPQQEAPKPGGFVVPGSQPQSPSSPPPAHVHPNSPWFRSS